ncbi:MAG: response regulator [Nitrospirae bacterium]|nr:MAG: response regulator [Nitrospirota bacterium]
MATILLADDDENFCNLLKVVLSHRGHAVLTAYNGREALRLFRQHRPQITLLDLRMPEMDGLEVLRRIRTTDPRAVVMILTAMGTDKQEQEARQQGVTDFLNKHLPFASLAALVDSVGTESGLFIKPGTVLLVDKSDETRDLFKAFLRTHVVSIRTARNGLEALTLMRDALPHLVVLDMDLGGIADPRQAAPTMTAPEFLHALRRMRYPGGLLLMCNTIEHDMEAQASNLQILDLLQKPVMPERLLVAAQAGVAIMEEASYGGPKPRMACSLR